MSKKPINIPGCKLDVVPTELIDEGERFRKDCGDLTDLCHSIKTQGLINPIAVVEKDGRYLLIAGGRRLRACQSLELPSIPVRIFTGEVSDLDLRILELAENIQRKDMTWQESNLLQREIHRLQQEKLGVPTGGPSSAVGWRVEDTATMLGVSPSTITSAISLTNKLEKYKAVVGDPSKFRTENDARKAVKLVEETILRGELVKRAAREKEADSAVQKILDSYQVGDALELMKTLHSESFDFCEIDPPYAIDLDNKKSTGTYMYREVPQEDSLSFYRTVLTQAYRVLKNDTFALMWFGPDPWFEYVYQIARDVGFALNRIPLLWTKPNGQTLAPNSVLANCYEMAFYMRKGSPVLAKPGHSNLFPFQPVAAESKQHTTEKPIELYEEIYRTFSFERANCLVPFAGSGASILAAYRCNRQAIGYDILEENKGGFIQKVHETMLVR